jgi:hypothetical protein
MLTKHLPARPPTLLRVFGACVAPHRTRQSKRHCPDRAPWHNVAVRCTSRHGVGARIPWRNPIKTAQVFSLSNQLSLHIIFANINVCHTSLELNENAECTCLRLRFLLSRFFTVLSLCLRSFRSSKAPKVFPLSLRFAPCPLVLFVPLRNRVRNHRSCLSLSSSWPVHLRRHRLRRLAEDGLQRRYHIITFSGLIQGDGRAVDQPRRKLEMSHRAQSARVRIIKQKSSRQNSNPPRTNVTSPHSEDETAGSEPEDAGSGESDPYPVEDDDIDEKLLHSDALGEDSDRYARVSEKRKRSTPVKPRGAKGRSPRKRRKSPRRRKRRGGH